MIALARRYRPKRFADLLVQDHVSTVLRGAVARGRVGHGYLLTGPRGVGKTTAARILAMALNCPNRDPSGEPCGVCEECVRVWNGAANLARDLDPAALLTLVACSTFLVGGVVWHTWRATERALILALTGRRGS